jgi:uncharacterized RDD family membrane protein YckC
MFAGPARRAAAALIDAFVVGALMLLVMALARFPAVADLLATLPPVPLPVEAGFFTPFAVPFLGALAYFVVFPATRMQATPGKSAVGVRIATVGGDRIGFLRSLVRYLASLVSIAIVFLGYLPMIWTRKRRALHDYVAGTVVVDRRARPAEIAWTEPPAPSWLGRIAATALYAGIVALPVIIYRGPLNGALAEEVNENNMKETLPVVAALETYRQKNGRYPETLEALSPGFIAGVPQLAGHSALRFASTPAGDGCWLAIVYWMEAGLLPHDRIYEYDCRTRQWQNLDFSEMHAAGASR